MSFHLAKQEKRHREQRWRQIGIMTGLIVVTVVIAFGTGFIAQGVILDPFAQVRIDDVSGTKITRRQLLARIDVLEQELASTESDRSRVQVLEDKVAELENLLGRGLPEIPHVAAVVRPPQFSLYESMIIDQGSVNGVTQGQRVIAEGVYLGMVSRVYPTTALVELATSSAQATWARTFDQGDVIKLEGTGSGNYIAKISRFIDLEIGDIVVDPSHEALIMGVVEEVMFDPRDPTQQILLRVPMNLGQLSWVEIWPKEEDLTTILEAEYNRVEGARILREPPVAIEPEGVESTAAAGDTIPQ